MAKHQWSVICNKAVVDKFTNNLTIFEVVEEVSLTIQRTSKAQDSIPLIVPVDFTVVSLWHRSESSVAEERKSRVRLLSPSGKSLTKDTELSIDLAGDKLRARNILNCRGVPIRESGEHKVQIQQLQKNGRWKTETVVPIAVKINILPGTVEEGIE